MLTGIMDSLHRDSFRRSRNRRAKNIEEECDKYALKHPWFGAWRKDPSVCPFCKSKITLSSDTRGYTDYYECLTSIFGTNVTAGTPCLMRVYAQLLDESKK